MGRLKFINDTNKATVVENTVILQQPISAEWVKAEIAKLQSTILPDVLDNNLAYVRRNGEWYLINNLSNEFVTGTVQTLSDLIVQDKSEFNGIVQFDNTVTFNNGLEVATGNAVLPNVISDNITANVLTANIGDISALSSDYVSLREQTEEILIPQNGDIRFYGGRFEFYENDAWRTLTSGGFGYVADAPDTGLNYVRRSGTWRRVGEDDLVFDDITNADFYDLEARNRAEINVAEIANLTVNQLGSIARLRLLDFDPQITPENGHFRFNPTIQRFEFYENDKWNLLSATEGSAELLREVKDTLDAHLIDYDNPHNVTALQVGADPAGRAQIVQNNLDLHTDDSTIHFTQAQISILPSQAGADPLGSASAVQSNLTTHINDTNNPHNVTALQVGADPAGSSSTVQSNLTAHINLTGTAVHGLGTAALSDAEDFMPIISPAIAGNLPTVLMDGTLIDSGNSVGYWMQRTGVASGNTITIPDNHQMLVYGNFTVDGDLITIGDLIIL